MLFNSATYLLLFLPALCLLYWSLRGNARRVLLIAGSILFYGFWRIEFVPLMLGIAVMDFCLGLAIDRREEPRARRRLMLVSVVVNLGVLGFFKYLLFFRDTLWSMAGWVGLHPGYTTLHIVLPLGISFYIFQTLSYTIDVYRRALRPERNLLAYLGFVTFFPHLVAGPIMRPQALLPQLRHTPPFNADNIRRGIERIIAGLFLKVVLADTVADFVNTGFAQGTAELTGLDAWTLAFLFGFQIYFDFAGYSSIAIGSAQLLSIWVPENFDWPYFARSPREFWQRWHISLSSWIRDYVYTPLGGAGRTAALFITWALMGLWHGAAWTFVLWGLYHAVMIYAQRLLGPRAGVLSRASWLLTLPLMMAAWIPFRSPDLATAFTLWGRMLTPWRPLSLSLTPNAYLLAAALLVGMLLTRLAREALAPRLAATGLPLALARVAYFTVAMAAIFVMLESRTQFIYFQF